MTEAARARAGRPGPPPHARGANVAIRIRSSSTAS